MQFSIFKCQIYISYLFFAVLIFILLLDKSGLMLFGMVSVFIHEAGHLAIMIILRCTPNVIILQPAGIIIHKNSFSLSRKKELLIAFGGCLANGFFALIFAVLYLLTSSENALLFSASNISIALFNIMPISGLDGYDILYLILTRFYSIDKCKSICFASSSAFIFAMFCLSFYILFTSNGNFSILICTLYLLILTVINLRC